MSDHELSDVVGDPNMPIVSNLTSHETGRQRHPAADKAIWAFLQTVPPVEKGNR